MEDNETFIKPANNEESYGLKVNDTMKATLFSLQYESKSFNILKAPIALGHQSENVNKMEAHKFINDFYTKKLGIAGLDMHKNITLGNRIRPYVIPSSSMLI